MLKFPDSYPRGRKRPIKSHCRVTVACDKCGSEWTTEYANYIRKKGQFDLCQSCKNRGGICGMKDKKHSEETKKKFSESRVGEKNEFYGKKHSAATKKYLSDLFTGRKSYLITDNYRQRQSQIMKSYWSSLSDEEKTARLANYDYSKMLKGLLFNGGKYSKLHTVVKQDMLSVGLTSFVSEYQIGSYVVDEFCKQSKTVIEINGDYWHANPSKYEGTDVVYFPKKSVLAREIWDRDNQRIKVIEALGLRVIVLWEHDIRKRKHLSKLRGLL